MPETSKNEHCTCMVRMATHDGYIPANLIRVPSEENLCARQNAHTVR